MGWISRAVRGPPEGLCRLQHARNGTRLSMVRLFRRASPSASSTWSLIARGRSSPLPPLRLGPVRPDCPLDSSPSPSPSIVKYCKVGPESAVEIVGRVPSYLVTGTLSFDSPQEVSNEFGLVVAHSRDTPQRSRGQRVDRVDGWPVLHRQDARVVVQRLQH